MNLAIGTPCQVNRPQQKCDTRRHAKVAYPRRVEATATKRSGVLGSALSAPVPIWFVGGRAVTGCLF